MNPPSVSKGIFDVIFNLIPWMMLCVLYFIYSLHLIAIFYAKSFLYKSHVKRFLATWHGHQNGQNCLNNNNKSITDISNPLPGVSIIKPLCGNDSKLYENLLSFFYLDYPRYEILFCVANKNDTVRDLVLQLLREHPHVDAKLLDNASQGGINEKVNNMSQGYVISKYELFLISDSGIWMRPDTLTDMVQVLQQSSKIGMVHQLPYLKPCEYIHRFQDAIQFIYFGCWHARMYLSAAFFGINCTSGMSCLMRKEALEGVGGLGAFSKYLAEDYFISKHMQENQWRVTLSHQPAWQNVVVNSAHEFEERISRWHRLRLSLSPQTTLFEPLTECFPVAGLTTMFWSLAFPFLSWCGLVSIFLLHISIWLLLDVCLLNAIHPKDFPVHVDWFVFLKAWLYREVHSIPLQLGSMWSPNIKWRENIYRVKPGGEGERVIMQYEKT